MAISGSFPPHTAPPIACSLADTGCNVPVAAQQMTPSCTSPSPFSARPCVSPALNSPELDAVCDTLGNSTTDADTLKLPVAVDVCVDEADRLDVAVAVPVSVELCDGVLVREDVAVDVPVDVTVCEDVPVPVAVCD